MLHHTIKRTLRRWIKANSVLYHLYTKIRYRKLAATRDWLFSSQRFIAKNGLNCFVICADAAYVRMDLGAEFLYVPEHLGGLLGLEHRNGFENAELEYAMQLVEQEATVLDIGANFGLYSILFAKKIHGVKIHSFEPVPNTFDIFCHNIEHNAVSEKITTNACAVGKTQGEALITIDRYAGNHLLYDSSTNENDTVSVPVITLDSYVEQQNIERVDFIKCDVEGAEFLVLQGAGKTLERDKPILLLEVADVWTRHFGYSPADIFNYLASLGYQASWFVDGDLTTGFPTFKEGDVLTANNFFFRCPRLPAV